MGVVEDDTLQVVVGPGTVNKVAQHMVDMAGVDLGETLPNAGETNGKLSVEEKAAQTKAEVNGKIRNLGQKP